MEKIVTILDAKQIIQVIENTLSFIDVRLMDHGKRVAYIVYEILQAHRPGLNLFNKNLFILSILHDIGAYKTEEIDDLLHFENHDFWHHSIYGYLFLKNMSPLGEKAEAILYHHYDYRKLTQINTAHKDVANLIFLADRIDILVQNQGLHCNFSEITKESGKQFAPQFIRLFNLIDKEELKENLLTLGYQNIIENLVDNLDIHLDEALLYLKMLVYSIDFRSEFTVTHTINTTSISVELAKLSGLDEKEQSKIYLGGLLHDLGKVAIPTEILEFDGKLTAAEMSVMKTHVEYSEKIIDGFVSDDIVQIACRHHEKLDGSGYPHGLIATDLTLAEKIVAIADILSALTSRRSYKQAFNKEKTLAILTEMRDENLLDRGICNLTIEHFDAIMKNTDSSRNPVWQMYQQMLAEYQSILDTVFLPSDLGSGNQKKML